MNRIWSIHYVEPRKKCLQRIFNNVLKLIAVSHTVIMFTVGLYAQPDPWPGHRKNGTCIGSSQIGIPGDLNLRWIYDNTRLKYNRNQASRGGHRFKNLAIRDGHIPLMVNYFYQSNNIAFVDIATGLLSTTIDSFSTELDSGTIAEYNPLGIEGRDVRECQYVVYWHHNGLIYARSGGDKSHGKAYRVSDSQKMMNSVGGTYYTVPGQKSNESAYFAMNDNCVWLFTGREGHEGMCGNGKIGMSHISDNALPDKHHQVSPGWGQVYNRCNPFLLDSNWVYMLGPTNHPVLTYAASSFQGYHWLGAMVRAFKIKGQLPHPADQEFENGPTSPEWVWSDTSAFVANDDDFIAAPKAWCLGKTEIYLVTQPASYDASTATVNYSDSLNLNGFDRNTGSAWRMKLGITAKGASTNESFGKGAAGCMTTLLPRICYIDRTDSGGSEYVAIMLPQAQQQVSGINKANSDLRTRLSVVDVKTKTELWNFEYPWEETTELWGYHCNSNTAMLIAGNAVFVAYAQYSDDTQIKLSDGTDYQGDSLQFKSYPYVDITGAWHEVVLHVDRFDLLTGNKTHFQFTLPSTGNTHMLDDLAAYDGKLFALITYREHRIVASQALVCLGEPVSHTTPELLYRNRSGYSEFNVSYNPILGVLRFSNPFPNAGTRLSIWDISGKKVATIGPVLDAMADWKLGKLSHAAYFLTAQAPGLAVQKKLIIIK